MEAVGCSADLEAAEEVMRHCYLGRFSDRVQRGGFAVLVRTYALAQRWQVRVRRPSEV